MDFVVRNKKVGCNKCSYCVVNHPLHQHIDSQSNVFVGLVLCLKFGFHKLDQKKNFLPAHFYYRVQKNFSICRFKENKCFFHVTLFSVYSRATPNNEFVPIRFIKSSFLWNKIFLILKQFIGSVGHLLKKWV